MQGLILLSICCLFAAVVVADPSFHWRSVDGRSAVVDGLFASSVKRLDKVKRTIERHSTYHFSVDSDLDVNESEERQCVLKSGFRSNFIAKSVRHSAAMATLANFVTNSSSGFQFSFEAKFARIVRFESRIFERSDFTPSVSACLANSSDLLALVVLSKNWRKNDYGEVTIYDRDGEIEVAVFPKYGRVVILPCGTQFKINPPAIDDEIRHYFLFAEFSSDPSAEEHFGVPQEPLASSRYVESEVTVDLKQYQSLDVSRHLSGKYVTSKGLIFVFDNVFPIKVIDSLKNYFWRHAQYTEVEIELDSEDNVRWLLSLEEKDFPSGLIWFFLKKMVDFASDRDTFYPYDIACNNIQRADNTIIHQDCNDEELEYTILTYLNPNVTENHYGETAFFTNNNLVTAIRPLYGRTVIFNGNIPHSARPLAPGLHGARYSYAVKTSKNEATARAKMAKLSSSED